MLLFCTYKYFYLQVFFFVLRIYEYVEKIRNIFTCNICIRFHVWNRVHYTEQTDVCWRSQWLILIIVHQILIQTFNHIYTKYILHHILRITHKTVNIIHLKSTAFDQKPAGSQVWRHNSCPNSFILVF